MTLKTCLLIENECYKQYEKMKDDKPCGIVVHSTGANNKNLKRYVQPIKRQSYYDSVIKDLGYNSFNNHWNNSPVQMGAYACVHAFIGENAKGVIETYKTLPWDVCCWGCGSGTKGSFNKNPNACIQFEICEDALTDETYFNGVMKEAQELCAMLCNQYGLKVDTIHSHAESHKLGYASNHGDCDHWLKKFGKDMNWFRSEVSKLLVPTTAIKTIYRVQVGAYTVKTNAEKMLAKLKNAGFSGFITTDKKE